MYLCNVPLDKALLLVKIKVKFNRYCRHIISKINIFFIFPVNTLLLGKPEKGKMVENMLIRMAQSGQIMTKIGEKDLIGLLENVSNQTQNKTTVKFDRRRVALDSDDDDF